MTERHCWSHLSRALRWVLLVMACITTSASGGGGSGLPGLTDAHVRPPPAIGSFAYNSFVPALTQGASHMDPVFGTTVQRLTTDHIPDDIYARNMWWNADETRYLHRTTNGTPWPDFWNVIDMATGKVTHRGIPIGGVVGGAGPFAADGGFDPVDPNVLYALGPTSIYKITLNADGTWTGAVYFTPPGGKALKSLGGTLNWFDASGRYMLVRYGPEPSVYLYDRQNLAAGPYANPVDGAATVDSNGYVGLSPDGQFLVGYEDKAGIGVSGSAGVSWKIDHANRTIASAPNIFWSLCGDHGSFLSASDGRNYMIVNDCYSSPQVWRVDITNNVAGLNEAQQHALPNNKLLLTYPNWNIANHMSAVARGPLQDWAFVATEDCFDTFNNGTADANGNITPWHAYRQEIIAANVITGEVRRLAHHRSRLVCNASFDYFAMPRLSASWGGKVVGFASNFNQSGVNDIYVIPFSATSETISPTVSSILPEQKAPP